MSNKIKNLPLNSIRIKTPGITFNKGKALHIPWWKMELILNIVTMDDKPKNVEYYSITAKLKPLASDSAAGGKANG